MAMTAHVVYTAIDNGVVTVDADLVTGKTLAWSDPKRRLSKRKKEEAGA